MNLGPYDGDGREQAAEEYFAEQQQAQDQEELYVSLTRIIHSAMMYGLPLDDAKLLCHGCGVDMKHVEQYR